MGRTGQPVQTLCSKRGMGGLQRHEFEPALLELIGVHLPDDRVTQVICCGMVGARQGWEEVEYIATPCTVPNGNDAKLAATNDPRIKVLILPGLKQTDPADVMRGEETQIAGFLEENHGFNGIICLPGTHTKWVQVDGEKIAGFCTFMTGELFSLLSERSVLRHSISATGWSDENFTVALADALSDPESISAMLFCIRAQSLILDLNPEAARARLSGLLIGMEMAAMGPSLQGQAVAVVGAAGISGVYGAGLEALNLSPVVVNANDVTLHGLCAAHQKIRNSAQ